MKSIEWNVVVDHKKYVLLQKVALAMVMTRRHLRRGPGNVKGSIIGSGGESFIGVSTGRIWLMPNMLSYGDSRGVTKHLESVLFRNCKPSLSGTTMSNFTVAAQTFVWSYFTEAGNCSDHMNVCFWYLRQLCEGETIHTGSWGTDHYFCIIGKDPYDPSAIVADTWAFPTQPVLLRDCTWMDGALQGNKHYYSTDDKIVADGFPADNVLNAHLFYGDRFMKGGSKIGASAVDKEARKNSEKNINKKMREGVNKYREIYQNEIKTKWGRPKRMWDKKILGLLDWYTASTIYAKSRDRKTYFVPNYIPNGVLNRGGSDGCKQPIAFWKNVRDKLNIPGKEYNALQKKGGPHSWKGIYYDKTYKIVPPKMEHYWKKPKMEPEVDDGSIPPPPV